MHLDLVTPEQQLLSEDVVSVQIPGMDGDMTVMGNHAPLVTTLRPGLLVINQETGSTEYLVTGGFAEISAEGVSILAESATPKAEMSSVNIETLLEEASTALENAAQEQAAALQMRVNDLKQLASRMNA